MESSFEGVRGLLSCVMPPNRGKSAIRRGCQLFGLERTVRKPPSKTTLWVYAVLCILGLALIVTTSHGLIHSVGVGLFGGNAGAWMIGRTRREDARREGQLRSN